MTLVMIVVGKAKQSTDLGSMAVVAATDSDSLLLQQVLHPTGGLPVELHVCDLALLVDESEGVHPKALHVAIVQGDANVILQEGELQICEPTSERRSARLLPTTHSPSHVLAAT